MRKPAPNWIPKHLRREFYKGPGGWLKCLTYFRIKSGYYGSGKAVYGWWNAVRRAEK